MNEYVEIYILAAPTLINTPLQRLCENCGYGGVADEDCFLHAFSIPKGLHPPRAQRLRGTSYPGCNGDVDANPEKGCGHRSWFVEQASAATLSGFRPHRDYSQGSSFLATLGFVAESLWDSSAPRRVLSSESGEKTSRWRLLPLAAYRGLADLMGAAIPTVVTRFLSGAR